MMKTEKAVRETPKSPIDDVICTFDSDFKNFLDDLGCEDRQETLKQIYDIANGVEIKDQKGILLSAISEIKELCLEFVK